jgi:regulator of PEP synthase PpsR (kinase-PPPase family)
LAKHPLIVGLTQDPSRLVEVRRQRLRMIEQDENTDYVDLAMVTKEINDARRLFVKHNWAMLNISRKSIEETAATVLKMFNERQERLL